MKTTISEQAREVPLDTFCLSLAHTYLQNPSRVNGTVMARLTQRLIIAESQPGGPYYGEKNTLDFPTNLAIAYLFALFKMPLPNLTIFISKHRPQAPAACKKLLHAYDQVLKNSAQKVPPKSPEHHAIFLTIKNQLKQLPQPEKPLALAFLQKIHQSDTSQEIALLPTFFANSLILPTKALPIQQLGEANIYCWIAYSIYDKIIDDEPAIQALPVANTAMRTSLKSYQNIFPQHHPFQQTILSTFTAMDHANAWEIAHCRFKRAGEDIIISKLPRYNHFEILADRCSGHILGSLAIASLCDVSGDARAHLEKGLRHYLIARQLSDDIHDWKEDFSAGHASSTVTHMLKWLNIQPGVHSFTSLSEALQENFWLHSMENFTAIIVRHLHHSRRHLLQSGILEVNGPLFSLHDRLETIAKQSLSEYYSSKAFLDQYSSMANDSHPLHQSPQP